MNLEEPYVAYNGEKKVNHVEYKSPQISLPKHYYRNPLLAREKIKQSKITNKYDGKNNNTKENEEYVIKERVSMQSRIVVFIGVYTLISILS